MNILFCSNNISHINLAEKLVDEGNTVFFFDYEDHWKKKIKRTNLCFIDDQEKALSMFDKKKDLIVFDDSGFGDLQDGLRERGYSVFGGCKLGEDLENNRQKGQRIFSALGMTTKDSIDFYDIDQLIAFIKKNRCKWVIKQNGHSDKVLNYVGELENAEDTISVLKNYKKILKTKKYHFDIQQRVEGIEIAVGRFFNGYNWVGPLNLNIEHKNLFNDNLGPKTHEMGNLMWYEEDEQNPLYQATLAKMGNYLRKINYKGYFDINCIVDKNFAYPLEATARLGQPTAQVQDIIHCSPWGEFMKAIADGKPYHLQYKKGYALIIFLGMPPYPYITRSIYNSPMGIEVFFKEKLTKEELDRIYFEEISKYKQKERTKYVICSHTGYIAHVGGHGKTVNEARNKTYELVKKIVIPKYFYRTDIGLSFLEKDQGLLKKWGWI